MKKHILYLGLNDKDSKQQEIMTLDAYKIAFNTIKKYYDGDLQLSGQIFTLSIEQPALDKGEEV